MCAAATDTETGESRAAAAARPRRARPRRARPRPACLCGRALFLPPPACPPTARANRPARVFAVLDTCEGNARKVVTNHGVELAESAERQLARVVERQPVRSERLELASRRRAPAADPRRDRALQL